MHANLKPWSSYTDDTANVPSAINGNFKLVLFITDKNRNSRRILLGIRKAALFGRKKSLFITPRMKVYNSSQKSLTSVAYTIRFQLISWEKFVCSYCVLSVRISWAYGYIERCATNNYSQPGVLDRPGEVILTANGRGCYVPHYSKCSLMFTSDYIIVIVHYAGVCLCSRSDWAIWHRGKAANGKAAFSTFTGNYSPLYLHVISSVCSLRAVKYLSA